MEDFEEKGYLSYDEIIHLMVLNCYIDSSCEYIEFKHLVDKWFFSQDVDAYILLLRIGRVFYNYFPDAKCRLLTNDSTPRMTEAASFIIRWLKEKALLLNYERLIDNILLFGYLENCKLLEVEPELEFTPLEHLWYKKQQEPEFVGKERREQIQSVSSCSIQWLGREEEREELFNEMKAKGLIHSLTPLEHFSTVFGGIPLDSVHPIRWGSDTTTELLYFIQCFSNANLINAKRGNRYNYELIKFCFKRFDGTEFVGSYKNLMQSAETSLGIERVKRINELAEMFK